MPEVTSGVTSRVTIIVAHIRGLMASRPDARTRLAV